MEFGGLLGGGICDIMAYEALRAILRPFYPPFLHNAYLGMHVDMLNLVSA